MIVLPVVYLPEQNDVNLYWKKVNGTWYMQLRSSLEH